MNKRGQNGLWIYVRFCFLTLSVSSSPKPGNVVSVLVFVRSSDSAALGRFP